MSIKIEINDLRVTRIIDDLRERKMIVEFVLIDSQGNVYGEPQEAIFWNEFPMDVTLEGEKVRPDIKGWFDMPAKYKRQMKTREADACEAVKVMLEES